MNSNTTTKICPMDDLRILEYSSQFGEAFRPLFGPRFTRVTYYVATSFVVAETVEKYREVRERHDNNADKVVETLTDMFLWRMMASIVFPGTVIRSICGFTGYRLAHIGFLPNIINSFLTTCVGLTSIPLILGILVNLITTDQLGAVSSPILPPRLGQANQQPFIDI